MRKLVTYAVVAATIVWSLGLAAVVPASAAYTPTSGDLVKTASDSAVYYIDADGNRNLFVNAVTFWSWYSGDWSDIMSGNETKSVMTISQEDFDGLNVNGNVTVRAGSRLIKFQNSPRVYAVTPGAELREIASSGGDDSVAKALYGDNYSVVTIQNGFEGNYTKGSALTTSSSLPDGSLVKYEGSEDIYYIQDGEKRVIEGDAFLANAFMDSAVTTIPSSMTYNTGSSIVDMEAEISAIDGASSGPVGPAGTLSVSLSSMTPASTTYIKNTARSAFLVVDFSNNGSTDVTVDSMKVERGGLAVDADFSSLSAYEDSILGAQIGLNKTLNSDHTVTFGDDFVVKAGTVKKVVFTGNIASGANAGDIPKLGLVSAALKGGSTLSGLGSTIWGNDFGINTSITVAAVAVAAGSSNPSTDTAPKVGDTDVEIAEVKVTNGTGSTYDDVQVESMVFKQAGTVSDSDVEMYDLVDSSTGVVVASAPQIDKYVTFVFGTPILVEEGKNESFMVRAREINDGSSRTIQLDIFRNTDLVAKDILNGAYVTPTFPASSQPYLDNTTSQTIGNGTVKIEASSTFNAANIPENQSGVQVAEWLFTVKGEAVDITQIAALLTTSLSSADRTDITNAQFFNVDTDASLTGASDIAATFGVTSTDTISLDVGVHKIGLKADLSADFTNNDTIRGGITAANLTVTGQVTGNDITPTPSAENLSSVQTIKTAKLDISVSINPPAQNVIRGDEVVAANVVLDASASGDDLRITQLKTDLHTTTMSPDEITSLTLWDGNTQLATSNDPEPTSTSAGASVSTTWTLVSAVDVTAGTVKTLTVKATTAGSTSANDIFSVGAGLGGAATVKDSEGEDVTGTYTYSAGQNMTVQTTGTLTLTRTDEMTDGMLTGNSTGLSVGTFSASAIYGDVDIEKMYVTMTAANSGGTDELTAVYLYDGATLIATASLTSSNQATVLFNMESSPLTVGVNSSKDLTIKVDTAAINNDGAATTAVANSGFAPSIASTDVTAKTNGNTATITSATLTFPTYRVLRSVPTVTIASSGDSLTANGEYDLADVTISADAKGPIGLYKMTFKVTTTTVTNSDYTVYEGNTLVATEDATATHGINKSYVDGSYQLLEVYFNLGGAIGGRLRQITAGTSKTYTLKASVTGYTSNVSNGVSVSMAGDAADDASTYYASATGIDALDNDDFIWSDLSYGNTSTTATTTTQWLNGFEIDSSGGLVGTTSSAKSI
jgi:hypothetical protein